MLHLDWHHAPHAQHGKGVLPLEMQPSFRPGTGGVLCRKLITAYYLGNIFEHSLRSHATRIAPTIAIDRYTLSGANTRFSAPADLYRCGDASAGWWMPAGAALRPMGAAALACVGLRAGAPSEEVHVCIAHTYDLMVAALEQRPLHPLDHTTSYRQLHVCATAEKCQHICDLR